MNSLKTGVIIAFGLTVLYGVYLVINKPQPTAEAKAEADAVEDLSIGEMSEGEETSDVAHVHKEHDSGSEATPMHEDPPGDEPEVEVAKKDSGSSRFRKKEKEVDSPPSTEPTEPSSPENIADEGEAGSAAPELKESEVAPWRNKPESTTKSRETDEPEATGSQRSRFRDEETTDAPAQTEEKETASLPVNEDHETESQEAPRPEVKIAPREAPALGAAEFDSAWTRMEQEIEEGKLKEALTTISPFFHAADLSDDDYKQLLEVLDLLAWRVVFSKEHYLAKPHIVAAGETLEDIAAKYEIPSEVIAKINGVKSAKLLTAGTELKVLPGPFRAEVSVERGELTLFLGDLYATRYAMESGTEPPPMPGDYEVVRRVPGATYPTLANREIPAQDPRNPYGGVFLDLGNDQCIHGSPEKESGEELGTGCMRLRGKDAKEVYWLLSKGSKVSVLR